MNHRHTREVLEAAVRECVSIAEVLRKLGLRPAGGTHSHISRRIKALGIDTSHFLGQRANSGSRHKGHTRTPWREVLVLRKCGRRQHSHVLRRALIESGREYRCEVPGCPVAGEWLGKPVMLHVNHKNGNWLDDRPENVEFVCPNCHSQTPNYCGSKGLSEVTRALWGRKPTAAGPGGTANPSPLVIGRADY
jgi:hypothetical protein